MNKNRERLTQLIWFTGGAICGLAMLSISKASIIPSHVTDDTAIYQQLSEIQISKQRAPDFDSGISHLAHLESHYHDNILGVSRRDALRRPMQRIAQQRYRAGVRGEE